MTKEKDRRFWFLDYVPPIVAFIAAIAAVVGSPKWGKAAPGFSKITSFGWIVLAIGLLALVISLMVTSRNKRKQVRQRQTKERIASISTRRLLRALQHAVHPIASNSIWRRQECGSRANNTLCRRAEGRLVSISIFMDSRLKSLLTLNVRSDAPTTTRRP